MNSNLYTVKNQWYYRTEEKKWNRIPLMMVARIFCTPSTGSTTNGICKLVSTTSGDYANFLLQHCQPRFHIVRLLARSLVYLLSSVHFDTYYVY